MQYNIDVSHKKIFNKIYLLLICFIIFLIPSNLFFKINPGSAYLNGLLVDYLIPKFYLSDIFIILLLSLHLIEVIKNKPKLIFQTTNLIWISILFSLLVIRQIFTPYPLAAAWYLLKLIELGLLTYFLFTHQTLFRKSAIYFSIITTIIFQSSLSLWQFITQKSLLGFKPLGEPNLYNSTGLSKDMWWHTGRVLPYATTAHPNILGGVLAIFSLILITKSHHKILTKATVFLSIIIIILTQSISAGLTLIWGLFFIFRKKVNWKILSVIGMGIFFITPLLINKATKNFNYDSLTRRSYLQNAAIKIILDNPIMGVGLNQFTAKVEEYSQAQEIVRFVQPVHHLGLLWLAETGVLGGLLTWVLIKKINLKKIALPLLLFLPIATLDHYLLTQQTGLLLTIFAIAFMVKR